MSINGSEELSNGAQDNKNLVEQEEETKATEKPKSLNRPILRPNGRFLRNTIASIENSNRRIQEKEMQARRKAHLEREGASADQSPAAAAAAAALKDREKNQTNKDSDQVGINGKEAREEGQSPNKVAELSVHDRLGEAHAAVEEELGGKSGGGGVQKKVRRGGTGPRIGPNGAYLPDPQIGLDSGVVERQGLKRKMSPLEPEEGRKSGPRSQSQGGSSTSDLTSSSSDSDSEEEERRRKRRKKRRSKEKERRKDNKKRKRKNEKRKKEKKEKKEKRRREKKSTKKSSKRRRRHSSSSSDSDVSV